MVIKMDYIGKKEKNLIELFANGKTYHYDFSNGNFIGLKGKPIKTIPTVLQNNVWFVNVARTYNNLSKLAEFLYLNGMELKEWDISFGDYECEKLSTLVDEKWNLVCKTIKYLKEKGNTRLRVYDFNRAIEDLELEPIYAERVNTNIVSLDVFVSYYHSVECDKYPKRLKTLVHYLNQGFQLCMYSNKLIEYYELCDKLECEYETGNFIKNFTKVKTDYEMRKLELDNKAIQRTQNTYNIAYSNENYRVVVPTERTEFENAGRILNNCLGGWELVNRVIPNKFQVGLIYDNNDRLVIAFDVNTRNKEIDQYYTFNNNRPNNENAIQFKAELQRYILENN